MSDAANVLHVSQLVACQQFLLQSWGNSAFRCVKRVCIAPIEVGRAARGWLPFEQVGKPSSCEPRSKSDTADKMAVILATD